MALGALAGAAGAPSKTTRAQAQVFRRVGIAFGTTVSITLEAADKQMADAAFAAGFTEIRAIDRLASLTRPDSEVFRLNREGFLDRPDSALVEMLHIAEAMHVATAGAFDITIQPLWLAFDAAARRGTWPSEAEIQALRERIDQGLLQVAPDRIAFAKPGMMITLNSLARGLAADRVAAALARTGIVNAFFDTDVLGAIGKRPDGAHWRALTHNPRLPEGSFGVADVTGCLATSGDYQYFWSADYSRNHII
ncbi:MAG: FAD:protein FMN transferase, partial [Hyphomicrobiales bacterium]|nr:FAD:protein FMN transferase [Hyphomicrobiales bacterium]